MTKNIYWQHWPSSYFSPRFIPAPTFWWAKQYLPMVPRLSPTQRILFSVRRFVSLSGSYLSQRGTMLDINEWDTGKYLGKIKQAEKTYSSHREHKRTSGKYRWDHLWGREELIDTTAILDYGSLMYIALQRSRTAREGLSKWWPTRWLNTVTTALANRSPLPTPTKCG